MAGQEGENNPSEWVTVQRRKPAATAELVIKPNPEKGGVAYADVLKQMKSNINTSAIGVRIQKIEKTKKGYMKIRLKGGTEEACAAFSTGVKMETAAVASTEDRGSTCTVLIKNIGAFTSAEEISESLKTEYKIMNSQITLKEDQAKKGQTAFVNVQRNKARELLEAGKINIGWLTCRTEEIIKPRKCYKCQRFGHNQRECKEPEEAQLCHRCGSKSHMVKECGKENVPHCYVCGRNGHRSDSMKCPAYRKAVMEEKENRGRKGSRKASIHSNAKSGQGKLEKQEEKEKENKAENAKDGETGKTKTKQSDDNKNSTN